MIKPGYKRLGDYIEPMDERNSNLSVKLSQGICNNKYFITPRQVAENSANDKIVRTGQFAYNRATTRNGDKISIAYREGPDCTVSSAYQIFRIKDENKLNPHYLWMWFRRPEFDRYARFKSRGSAHEFFEWDEMCEVYLPIPDIDEQRRIVAEYQAVEKRIATNEALIAKLEETAQTIYKKMFVDDIDPESLPEGWHYGNISEIARLKVGGDKPEVFSEEITNVCSVPVYANGTDNEGIFGYTDRASVTGRCVTITARGTIGCCFFRKTPFVPIVRLIVVQPLKECYDYYLFHNLAFANLQGDGSVQSQLTVPQLQMIKILIPSEDSVAEFHCKVEPLDEHVDLLKKENSKMREVLELFLSKMS